MFILLTDKDLTAKGEVMEFDDRRLQHFDVDWKAAQKAEVIAHVSLGRMRFFKHKDETLLTGRTWMDLDDARVRLFERWASMHVQTAADRIWKSAQAVCGPENNHVALDLMFITALQVYFRQGRSPSAVAGGVMNIMNHWVKEHEGQLQMRRWILAVIQAKVDERFTDRELFDVLELD